MQLIRCKAHSRVGLVGNPSDGYNGKTLSVTIRDFRADVILYEWERLELILSQEDKSQFNSIHELAQDVELHGYYGGIRLVKATIRRFVDYCDAQQVDLHERNFSVRYESNIPRQVGLAGSSAIVVATLRALMQFYEVSIPADVQASLALSVERNELGIGAGLQDRVAQVYDQPVFMNFSQNCLCRRAGYECGRYSVIDSAILPPLYVAYKLDASEPTEIFHNDLRARYDRGEDAVVRAMTHFADLAERAHQALLAGHSDQLGAIMDENFDTRQSICRLPESHRQMVRVAREAGATAKFAGSGGAIVGTYPNAECFAKLTRMLTGIGCRVLKPTISEVET